MVKSKFRGILFITIIALISALLLVSCGGAHPTADYSHTFSLKCDYGVHEEGPEAIRLFGDPCISPWNTHIYPLMGINFKEVKYALAVSSSTPQTATIVVLGTPDGKQWSILDAKKVVINPPYSTFSGDIKLTTTLTSARALEVAVDGKRVMPGRPDGVMLVYSQIVIPDYKRSQCNLQNRAIGSLVSTYLYRKVWIHDIGCQVYVEKLPVKVRVLKLPATATVSVLTESGTLSRTWQVVATLSLTSSNYITSTLTVNAPVRFVKIETSELSDYSWVVTSAIGSKR